MSTKFGIYLTYNFFECFMPVSFQPFFHCIEGIGKFLCARFTFKDSFPFPAFAHIMSKAKKIETPVSVFRFVQVYNPCLFRM